MKIAGCQDTDYVNYLKGVKWVAKLIKIDLLTFNKKKWRVFIPKLKKYTIKILFVF